jgi:hypothetical protein
MDRSGAVLRHLEEVVAEEVDGGRRVVELVDQQDVGPVALNHFGDVPSLPAIDVVHFGVRKVIDELAGVAAVQRGVERGKADVGSWRIGLRGRCERQQCDRGKQESSHESLPSSKLTGNSILRDLGRRWVSNPVKPQAARPAARAADP